MKERRAQRAFGSLVVTVAAGLLAALPPAGAGSGTARAAALQERPSIRFGLLPIVDGLPFWVAQAKGYFDEAGVQVDLAGFRSSLERDAALQAGAIDGFLGDLMATASLASSGLEVRIVSISLGMTPAEGTIAILSAPGSGITRPEQLREVSVAISRNSMIEYVVDRLLEGAGIPPSQRRFTIIPGIPDRFTALMSGRIRAAGLPDPLQYLAEQQGARIVATDANGPNLSQSVLLVRADRIVPRREALRRMLAAYRRAVADINRDPNAYRSLLVDRGSLPEALRDTYPVHPFPLPALPPRQPVEELLQWMRERGRLAPHVTYESITTPEFVGGPAAEAAAAPAPAPAGAAGGR